MIASPQKRKRFVLSERKWLKSGIKVSLALCPWLMSAWALWRQLFWRRRDEENQQSWMHGFSSKKVKVSSLFFQETYSCLYIWRDKGEDSFYLLPLGILLLGNPCGNRHNLAYKYSQILSDWIGTTHVRRLFQTFHWAFVFLNLFLTHLVFSHRKLLLLWINYCYWLCLVNGSSITFVYLIYLWQVSPRSLAAPRKNKMGVSY